MCVGKPVELCITISVVERYELIGKALNGRESGIFWSFLEFVSKVEQNWKFWQTTL